MLNGQKTKGGKQLLAYMDLVHSGRIERHKADTTVYGISADSMTWNFYRIDNHSKWCCVPKVWGHCHNENKKIILMLLYIMQQASEQTPVVTFEHTRQFSYSAGDNEPVIDC